MHRCGHFETHFHDALEYLRCQAETLETTTGLLLVAFLLAVTPAGSIVVPAAEIDGALAVIVLGGLAQRGAAGARAAQSDAGQRGAMHRAVKDT